MIRIKEAAARLQYHPESMRRLVRQGKIPARKRGKHILFDEGDIEQFGNGIDITPEVIKRLQKENKGLSTCR
jgi:excisionase family DNA binding protein